MSKTIRYQRKSQHELLASVRKDWGNVNPWTKAIAPKKGRGAMYDRKEGKRVVA